MTGVDLNWGDVVKRNKFYADECTDFNKSLGKLGVVLARYTISTGKLYVSVFFQGDVTSWGCNPDTLEIVTRRL